MGGQDLRLIFNDRIEDLLNVVETEHKLFYMLGDHNIDFLKGECHKPTSALLDILYSNNVFPLITKPTRVTKNSATLIDHILTNNIHSHVNNKQGILCSSISDHFAIFHIALHAKQNNANTLIDYHRDMRKSNVLRFNNEIAQTSWDDIYQCNDIQLAYSTFHKKIIKTLAFLLLNVKSMTIESPG